MFKIIVISCLMVFAPLHYLSLFIAALRLYNETNMLKFNSPTIFNP